MTQRRSATRSADHVRPATTHQTGTDLQRQPHTDSVLPLPRAFYDRPAPIVARELLGKYLLREPASGQLLGGIIVEVEAYLAQNDPANHAYRGRTRRNESMFGPPGHAYIYAIHSRHCLNVVTEPAGVPSAVLIRAIEPKFGMQIMEKHRCTTDIRELARGPGKLCQALALDRHLDGWDLTLGRILWIAAPHDAISSQRIAVSTRIGVTAAKNLPLRFFLANSPFVSGHRRVCEQSH